MKVKAKEAAGYASHPFWMSTVRVKPGERPAGRLQPEQSGQRGQRTKGASVCTQDPPPQAPVPSPEGSTLSDLVLSVTLGGGVSP